MEKKIRVVFVQRFMLHYRVDLYERINDDKSIDLTLLHGRGVMNSKFVNYEGPVSFKHKELKTIQLKTESKLVLLFPGLFFQLIRLSPDIIIAEGESNMLNNIAIYFYSVLFNRKIAWWGLGLIPGWTESVFQKMYRPFMLLFLRRASAIIGYSEYSREYYSRFADINKIVVAYNCLDNEKIDNEIEASRESARKLKKELQLENKYVILFVGAFTSPKRIDKLIKAFYAIKADHPESVLMIVGDGRIRDEFESLVKSLDLKDVIFAGKVIEGVSKYFLVADLFVLPGLGGLSIHHAMIHGLPVISASADGTERDLVKENQNGFLLKTDTVEELTELLRRFLNDKSMSEKFGLKSREIVDNSINIGNKVKTFLSVCKLK
jgi:glycosyltransferase involved in cell wall biosynthesis